MAAGLVPTATQACITGSTGRARRRRGSSRCASWRRLSSAAQRVATSSLPMAESRASPHRPEHGHDRGRRRRRAAYLAAAPAQPAGAARRGPPAGARPRRRAAGPAPEPAALPGTRRAHGRPAAGPSEAANVSRHCSGEVNSARRGPVLRGQPRPLPAQPAVQRPGCASPSERNSCGSRWYQAALVPSARGHQRAVQLGQHPPGRVLVGQGHLRPLPGPWPRRPELARRSRRRLGQQVELVGRAWWSSSPPPAPGAGAAGSSRGPAAPWASGYCVPELPQLAPAWSRSPGAGAPGRTARPRSPAAAAPPSSTAWTAGSAAAAPGSPGSGCRPAAPASAAARRRSGCAGGSRPASPGRRSCQSHGTCQAATPGSDTVG